MGEQNPLQMTVSPVAQNCDRNPRNPKGRPCKTQSIKFSTQPRSIVSQMIQKMIAENNIIIPIEQNSEHENKAQSIHIEELNFTNLTACNEADDTEEFIEQKPKKQYCKRNEKKKPKTYACDFSNCLYNTKIASNLQKHKRRHTGDKPYLCDRCSFRTNFSNSLRVHRRLHTTERPYQCTQCDYRCNSISNLKKHNHTKHIKNSNEDGQPHFT